MKPYLTIIQSLALFLGANTCLAATTWTDFTNFSENPDRNGVSLTLTNGTIDENGHINLKSGSAQFNFTGATAPNRPTLDKSAQFSIAITYGAGSMDSLAPLFSSAWGPTAYRGLFGCSYDPTSQEANVAYWGTSQTNGAFPSSSLAGLDPSKSLTLVFSQGAGNIISYSFYSNTQLIGTISSTTDLSFSGRALETLTIGGKGNSNSGSITNGYAAGSTMDILGISYKTGGTFSTEEMNTYLKQALPVPEPATASLCVIALASCMLRRRRI